MFPGFMRRHRLRTTAIVVLVAIAVAGNAVAFGTLKRRLYPSFPYPDESRLSQVRETVSGSSRLLPYSLVRDVVDHVDLLDGASAYDIEQVMVSSDGEPLMTVAQIVTPSFFHVLGATPVLGRLFSDEDEGAPVALLQHSLWTKIHGGNTELPELEVVVNGRTHDVIGVLEEGFSFLTASTGIWLPFDSTSRDPTRETDLLIRAAPGVTRAQVEAAVTAVAAGAGWTSSAPGDGFRISPLDRAFRGPRTPKILVLIQLSMLGVLLLASINIGIVQLADTQRRLKELGTRMLLGATRTSVAGLLWLENLVQALLGGALGLYWLLRRSGSCGSAPRSPTYRSHSGQASTGRLSSRPSGSFY